MFSHLDESKIPNPYGGGVIDLSELTFTELSNILDKLSKHKANKMADYIWDKVYKTLKNYTQEINMLS